KAALLELCERWPGCLSLEGLLTAIELRLGPAPDRERGRRLLAQTLLNFFLSNLVELHVHEPHFVLEVSERPVASPLARLQAARGEPVATLINRVAVLNDLDRAVLRHLDGRHDRAALLAALEEAVARGELRVQRDGQAVQREAVRAALASELGPSLERL